LHTVLQRLVISLLAEAETAIGAAVDEAGGVGGGEGVRDSERNLKCAILDRRDGDRGGALAGVGGGVGNPGTELAILLGACEVT
jgi:hypothetical protein